MALVTYNRTSLVPENLSTIATKNGIVNISGAPIIGAIVRSVEDSLAIGFSELYDLAKNVDIGRSTGQFLDRWGSLLNERRSTVGFATDISLTNTFIAIIPERPVGSLTVDGNGIVIPNGTILRSEDGTYSVSVIGNTTMRSDRSRVYVKVIATSETIESIPPGALTVVDLSPLQIPNFISGVARNYSFSCYNSNDIVGGSSMADDELYRYILQESSQSLWLFNDARIRKVLDILAVRNVVINVYRGGSIVYIEATEPSIAEQVAVIAERSLLNDGPLGLSIRVAPVIYRTLALTLKCSLTTGDPSEIASIYSTIAAYITNRIGLHYSGDNVQIDTIVQEAQTQVGSVVDGISIVSATVDGRSLVSFTVQQYQNQKLITEPSNITFV
jgi:hypothetical protein